MFNPAKKTLVLSLLCCGLMIGCKTQTSATKSTGAPPISFNVGAPAEGVNLPAVTGGPAKGKVDDKLEVVATFNGPAMPVAVAISQTGRFFLSFPRWNDPVRASLMELRDNTMFPYPNAQTNEFDPAKPDKFNPATRLISVQALTFDSQDRLWVLDPGSFNFGPNLLSGPKLWCYDLSTNKVVHAISFPTDVAMKTTALNDVRIDLRRGSQGTAYITDSGVGGIIVVDIASKKSWRKLDKHPSVMPTVGLKMSVEGKPFIQHKPTGEKASPDFRADGIALSPDGKTLYYMPVVSRDVYAISTDLLADPSADSNKVGEGVKKIATKPSGNDGIACDAKGRIYTTDVEDNCIRRIDPQTGEVTIVVQDERLIWPDSVAIYKNDLYITVNQLPRQSTYNAGVDKRVPPYSLVKVRIDSGSIEAMKK